eukprot:337708_1
MSWSSVVGNSSQATVTTTLRVEYSFVDIPQRAGNVNDNIPRHKEITPDPSDDYEMTNGENNIYNDTISICNDASATHSNKQTLTDKTKCPVSDNHIPYKWNYLSSSISLRTTDEAITSELLPNYNYSKNDCNNINIKFFHSNNDKILAGIENILTVNECNQIIEHCTNNSQMQFQQMDGNKYDKTIRKSQRLLILDERFADLLYNRLSDLIQNDIILKYNISCIPLGFGVLNGNEWDISSVNKGMRINRYSSNDNDFFSHHKDAQFCANSNKKSLFTLIIYLNDDYSGGETNFYFENDINRNIFSDPQKQKPMYGHYDYAGMTMREEIKVNGGIKNGYKCIKVLPKQCNGVIFSQDLIHEGCKMLS